MAVADAYQGISLASPPTCVDHEPELSDAFYNQTEKIVVEPGKRTDAGYAATSTALYLWYVSEDNGPFRFLAADGHASAGFNDVGQRSGSGPLKPIPGRRMWPDPLPTPSGTTGIQNDILFAKILSISGDKLTLDQIVLNGISDMTVALHDDTVAIQEAINAASAAGGGTVVIPAGQFLIQRPQFITAVSSPGAPKNAAPTWDIAKTCSTFCGWNTLNLFSGVTVQGHGTDTTLVTAPTSYTFGMVFMLASKTPTWRAIDVKSNLPAYGIKPLAKGSTRLLLANVADAGKFKAQDDVWLYTGSWSAHRPTSASNGLCVNTPSRDDNGKPITTAGGNCHYSEINRVKSVNSATGELTLQYPATRNYFDDGTDSFGIANVAGTTVDRAAIEKMTIVTDNQVLRGGAMALDLTVDSVVVAGYSPAGTFGTSTRRFFTIKNSTWNVGSNSNGWHGTDEFDQFSDVSFLRNHVYGLAAPGRTARIYGTEGSTLFNFTDNDFYDLRIVFQLSPDLTVFGNRFQNSALEIGGYNDFSRFPFVFQSGTLGSSISIKCNTFDLKKVPFISIKVGYSNNVVVSDNQINVESDKDGMVAISVADGVVRGNTITIESPFKSKAIVIAPQIIPGAAVAPMLVEDNRVVSPQGLGVSVENSAAEATADVRVQNNAFQTLPGKELVVQNTSKGDVPHLHNSMAIAIRPAMPVGSTSACSSSTLKTDQ